MPPGLPSGESVEERRRALVAKIGENISVRRFALLSSSDHLGAYVHGTRIGALVALEGGTGELAHDVAMHVAASNPRYLSQAQVPAEVMAKEREILAEQAAAEGKPPEIVAKMVEGRLRKSLSEITLRRTALREGSGRDDREAAEGRQGRSARASSASRSAPASRRSRTTSWPRSWRR